MRDPKRKCMAMPKLTESEQKGLRAKAKRELERLEKLTDEETWLINDFLTRFLQCEVVYKVVLRSYQAKKPSKSKTHSTINLREARTVLKFAGCAIDDSLLSSLFGSTDGKNNKSCKSLRNNLTHARTQTYIDYLVNHETELTTSMDTFLDAMRT